MGNILRDPIWQFIGIIIGLLVMAVPYGVRRLRGRLRPVDVEHEWSWGPVRGLGLASSRLGDELAISLGQWMWSYPDAGGASMSWAVKESDVLRGEIDKAKARPGLGIALFTSELARELFGDRATPKIAACVEWGLAMTESDRPYLILDEMYEPIDGSMVCKRDLRHTIALAILMRRAARFEQHQHEYREVLRHRSCEHGGWPAEDGVLVPELSATTYALEYLVDANDVELAQHAEAGRRWLASVAHESGGWTTATIPGKAWGRLWATSYVLTRLLSVPCQQDEWWHDVLEAAAHAILTDVAEARRVDALTAMRLEARAACALREAVRQGIVADRATRERVEAWLTRWQKALPHQLASCRQGEMDVATCAFACRGMLWERNASEVGQEIMKRMESTPRQRKRGVRKTIAR